MSIYTFRNHNGLLGLATEEPDNYLKKYDSYPIGEGTLFILPDGTLIRSVIKEEGNTPVEIPIEAQVKALSDRQDFIEDCIAEMAMIVYM